MYDYSALYKTVLDSPVTNKNLTQELIRISPFGSIDWQSSIVREQLINPIADSEFCISGTVYSVLPILNAPSVRDNYLYVQGFIIFSAGTEYFTSRQNTDSFQILYTLSGKGLFEYEGKKYYLNRGDGIFIDCKKPHFYKTIGPVWTHSVIHFNGAGAAAYYKEFASLHCPVFSLPLDSQLQTLSEQLLTYYMNPQPSRDVLISNTLSNILVFLITNNSDSESEQLLNYMRETIEYMENHYTENLTLDDLAAHVYMNKYSFSRDFRKLTGFSPIEYVIQLRLNQAGTLLKFTDLTVCKIADLVGIPNEQYFGKLFKKRTGLTPGQFRKQIM